MPRICTRLTDASLHLKKFNHLYTHTEVQANDSLSVARD